MSSLLPWVIAALPLALAAGCGPDVSVEPSGASGTTGSGGAGGTGSTTAITSSTGTGAPDLCGGKGGLPCPPSTFCKWNPPVSCGKADGSGVCEPVPGGCPADCPGVCGCDGQFYCNACSANAAGVDVDGDSSCAVVVDGGPPPPPDHYVAWVLATNLPRFAIAKIEPSADLCVVLVVAQHDGPTAGLVIPPGWSVEQSWIQQGAAACEGMVGSIPVPPAQSVMASGGGGTLKYDNNSAFPCFLFLNAAQAFPPGAPWVPATDLLDTDNLPVQGAGCGG